jgi:hypothetical protein
MVEESEQPKELVELSEIHDFLIRLSEGASRIHEQLDVSNQLQAQSLLQQYASILAYLPKTLSLLHDYQRHASRLYQQADKLLHTLESVRKNLDALSSEEQRVIVEVASVKEITNEILFSLEKLLLVSRKSSRDLLLLIAFSDDDFSSFAKEKISSLCIDMTATVSYTQALRVEHLLADIKEFLSIQLRAEQLHEA